ncbi:MAG: TetR/AcrR family transcriptional regulator [Flaviflexus sp.]|nr:TetR/AcrR family transcriptional regulator [Flaviflexus sp.]
MPKIEANTVAEHRAMREANILAAAAQILNEGGPTALNPSAAARRAGMSRTAVYHYYPTSADLLMGALDYLMDKAVAKLEDAINEAGDSPMEQIEAYVRASLGAARSHYCTSSVDAVPIGEEHRERLHAWHERLLAPLCQIAAGCRAPNAELAARLVQGMIDGAVRAIAQGADEAETTETTLLLLRSALGHGHVGRSAHASSVDESEKVPAEKTVSRDTR